MSINLVNGITQVNLPEGVAKLQTAAKALQTEQRLFADAAENRLSAAAQTGRHCHSKTESLHGEIMDSQCAEIGTHGIVNPLKTTRECTIDCVRFGESCMLCDPAVQLAYGLDDQRKAQAFAGDRVDVIGALDKTTHTIHVLDIRPSSDRLERGR